MTIPDLPTIANQAEHSCHHAMLAMIHFNLMVDVTPTRVTVKGLKAGMLQGTTLQFDEHNKETIIRLAISRAALKEIDNADA